MISFKKLVSIFVVLSLFMVLSVNVYSVQKESSAASTKASRLININTASAVQLTKLPRIGEKISQRIIDFRKNNGKFKKSADLMKVKGIGEKIFEKLRKLITV
ncbi:MAG: helix-hairpin-helix domain-containing protein [Candidatus Aminicenantes bacterium]|nr:helix-hairpin-helix domain-containing protein [Candidatus Aminicenantes bacterium]